MAKRALNIAAEACVQQENDRQDRHDPAKRTAGAVKHDQQENQTGNESHRTGLAVVVRKVGIFIADQVDGPPQGNDQHHVDDAADQPEGLILCKFVLKDMLIKRQSQDQDGETKRDVNGAHGDNSEMSEYDVDLIDGHGEGKYSRNLAEDSILLLFDLLRRCQLGVQ